MKRILFAFFALVGIMTSCTNDDITILNGTVEASVLEKLKIFKTLVKVNYDYIKSLGIEIQDKRSWITNTQEELILESLTNNGN